MPFSDHELNTLRAESHAHRMALNGQVAAETKRRASRRRLLLIVALILATVALFLTTIPSWGEAGSLIIVR